jgi:hypothetical protein
MFGHGDILLVGEEALTQRRKGAKAQRRQKYIIFFASLRLCAFAFKGQLSQDGSFPCPGLAGSRHFLMPIENRR